MSTSRVRAGRPYRPEQPSLFEQLMEELPDWLLDFYLVGVIPEAGTPEAEAFHTLRFRSSRATIKTVYMKHRAAVIRAAQALGFVRPDEPHGEHVYARDEKGMPLPLPPGVVRVEEGEPSPWWADRFSASSQAILRQQLREQRGLAGADDEPAA